AFTVAVLFSLTPFYLKDTFWVGSSRGFVVGLVPVFVLLLVNHLRTNRFRFFVLAIVLIVLLTTIHRMGVLTLFILIGYLFAIPFHKVTQKLRFAMARYERPSRYVLFFTGVIGFISTFYIAEFLFLFFVILLVFGLFSIRALRPNRRKLVSSVVVGLLLISVAASWVMKDYWRERYSTDAPIPNNTYSTGVYIVDMTSGTIVANDGILGGQLA